MGLFSAAQMDAINQAAIKSKAALAPVATKKTKNSQADLDPIYKIVSEYFKDSPAILIETKDQLHEYVSNVIESGIAGIDTETTGLDRINDYVVGASLYYPGGVECYIPMKHRIPIFEELYSNQLTYEEVSEEFKRIENSDTKLIFANADFDLSMIYKDLKVDFSDRCYYDVILAWRCLKEDELHNGLKELYHKYVMYGKGDAKRFSDFFTPAQFPYCKPEYARLYAANDAKITYELYMWQLPYTIKDHPKCKKAHLEGIADLIWGVEMPLIKVCQQMHRTGMYIDQDTANVLKKKYNDQYNAELNKLQILVQEILDTYPRPRGGNRQFTKGSEFNPASPVQTKYLLKDIMGVLKEGQGTGKDILADINLPVTNQILKVRSLSVLIDTFVDKLPDAVASDGRIHASFKQVGADCVTGDTIIPTSNGWLKIGDLCELSGVKEGIHTKIAEISICNQDQISETADSVIRYTNYPVVNITTENGFHISGTYNHPIMVSKYTASDNVVKGDKRLPYFWNDRYFKQLKDIQVGDWIEIPCNFNIGPKEYVSTDFILYDKYQTSRCDAKLPDTYDENFAEFLGMYHADGSASLRDGTYTISISNVDEDVRNRIDDLSLKLFNVNTSHYSAQIDNNEYETYINCMQIRDIDKILSHGKQNKKIPDAIWISPSSVISAYIRGMTLDSSVYFDENGRAALELSIIDESDADFVQQYLCSIGILCHRGWNENKGGWKTPRLSFNADNYILFRDKVGFIQSKKYVDTVPNRKQSIEYRRIDNSFRVKVKSISKSIDTVYDFTVPGTHSFISNGMISHNTGRMSSADPNLQNIPSHATDIRHMFRATPAYYNKVDCIESEGDIHCTISKFDSLLKNEKYVKISDCIVGDIVTVYEDHQAKSAVIKLIDFRDDESNKVDVVLGVIKGG